MIANCLSNRFVFQLIRFWIKMIPRIFSLYHIKKLIKYYHRNDKKIIFKRYISFKKFSSVLILFIILNILSLILFKLSKFYNIDVIVHIKFLVVFIIYQQFFKYFRPTRFNFDIIKSISKSVTRINFDFKS